MQAYAKPEPTGKTMGANISSSDQRLHSRKPILTRTHHFNYETNSPFVVEMKNKNQWNSRLNALKDTNKLLVIEFTAKWCGPCKTFETKIKELAAKYIDVEFVKIDIDLLTSVWIEYKLHSFPAIVFMKRGQEVGRFVGVKVDELERKLHKYTQSFF